MFSVSSVFVYLKALLAYCVSWCVSLGLSCVVCCLLFVVCFCFCCVLFVVWCVLFVVVPKWWVPVGPACPDVSPEVCVSMGNRAMTLDCYLKVVAVPDPTWMVSGLF